MISGLCVIKGIAAGTTFPEFDGGDAYDVGINPFDSGAYVGGDAFTQPPNEYDGGDATTVNYGILFDNTLF
jgi:hypothetical protein